MMETIKEMMKVMQAFDEGKKIEYKHRYSKVWSYHSEPEWNWQDYQYKVRKPKTLDMDVLIELGLDCEFSNDKDNWSIGKLKEFKLLKVKAYIKHNGKQYKFCRPRLNHKHSITLKTLHEENEIWDKLFEAGFRQKWHLLYWDGDQIMIIKFDSSHDKPYPWEDIK